MARIRQTARQNSYGQKRTTWTPFHLPRDQPWPKWSTNRSDAHRGPLEGVAGVRKVYLGRKVEDPTQAALIVVWNTLQDLESFQRSPACTEFLRCLPAGDGEATLLSGALLQGPSISDAGATARSEPPASSLSSGSFSPTSRFITFRCSFFRIEQNLEGRLTTTVLRVRYTESHTAPMFQAALDKTFSRFFPHGERYEDAAWSPKGRPYFLQGWVEMDGPASRAGGDHSQQLGGEVDSAAWCEFRRWPESAAMGASPEREASLAVSPRAQESWAQKVAQVTPPVTAWEQERWDVQVIHPEPKHEEKCDEDDEDPEEAVRLDAFCKQHLPA